MKRRVCHILGSSGLEGTGIARIVSALHRHVDPEKYQLSACFVGDHGPLVETFTCLDIPVNVIAWKHPSKDLAGALRLIRHLRSERFDIVHFHWGGPTLRKFVRQATGSRVILHLHSEMEEGTPARSSIPTEGSDMVIAVSRSVARVSQHPQTRVVYSGVDAGPRAAASRNKSVIGFAGRLITLKGLEYLFEALRLLKMDWPYLQARVAGTGPDLERLRALVLTLDLQRNITFIGWVDDLAEERTRWTMIVQPSLKEGLPLSVIEAMADGIPAIASRVGGIPELIEDGITGLLVEPADAGALANAIRKLLAEPKRRHEMGEAAAERAGERFSAKKMTDSVSALYDELLLG